MLYGLLLERVNSQEQKQETTQANWDTLDEDESWCLGMEAWVSCGPLHPGQLANC